MIKRNTLYFILMLFVILAVACKKDSPVTAIPNVPVNITLSLTLPDNAVLNSPGGAKEISGGYKGIIVYRRSISDFVAFDMACPYDPTTEGAILKIDSSGVTSVDLHCGSKFSLYDGSVIHGPATTSMKPYQTEYSSSANTLAIYN
jgi:hypothetical protein